MIHNIGDLLLDYSLILPRDVEIDATKAKHTDFKQQYVYGLIVDIQSIQPEEFKFLKNRDSYIDNKFYTILWADYDKEIGKYSFDQIAEFKNNLLQVEKEIENEADKKQTNIKTKTKRSKPKDEHV